MGSALLGTGRAGTTNSGSGSNTFPQYSDGDLNPLAGENTTQRPITNATVTSGLVVRTTADDTTTGSTVVIVRINTADDPSGQSISVAAGSGAWEAVDTSHTSAIAANDLVGYSQTVATGGTGVKYSFFGMVSTPTSGATIHAYCLTNTSISGTSNSFYFAPGSTQTSAADTEAGKQQLKSRCAGTLTNLTYRIGNNTRTTTSSMGARINGSNTSIIISVLSTDNNKQIADTSHTAAVAVADLFDTYTTSGTGVGSCNALTGALELSTTTGQATPTATASTTNTVAASATVYQLPQAKCVFSATTETFQQMRASVATVVSGAQFYATANGITATSTITSRIGGAPGNQSISIPSGGTTWMEDTSHTDACLITSEFDWQLVTGATGTTLQTDFMAYLSQIANAGPLINNGPLLNGGALTHGRLTT